MVIILLDKFKDLFITIIRVFAPNFKGFLMLVLLSTEIMDYLKILLASLHIKFFVNLK
jgi:hypothetical protein